MKYIHKLLDWLEDIDYPYLFLWFLAITAVEMLIIGISLLIFCISQSA